jgi:copper chaperone
MEKILFKTSLKCNGCIQAITPGIESIPEVQNWKVDLESPDKVLEVTATVDISGKVLENVKKAGYEISRL